MSKVFFVFDFAITTSSLLVKLMSNYSAFQRLLAVDICCVHGVIPLFPRPLQIACKWLNSTRVFSRSHSVFFVFPDVGVQTFIKKYTMLYKYLRNNWPPYFFPPCWRFYKMRRCDIQHIGSYMCKAKILRQSNSMSILEVNCK